MTSPIKPTPPAGRTPVAFPDGIFRQIAQAVGSLRFGSVEITVHEGHVVQIEKREKLRLEPFRDNQSRPTAGVRRPSNIQTDPLTGPPEASHETNLPS